MKEVLQHYKSKIDASKSRDELNLEKQSYFLVSIHREENVDHPESLTKILYLLSTLADKYDIPVIVSTHPRTRKRIEELQVEQPQKVNDLIQFMKPFGFLDYVHLQEHAKCVISDSGTISEESSILGFPAISVRQSMERPEAQDVGSIILTGFDPNVVISSIEYVVDEFSRYKNNNPIPEDYQITDTSNRVAKLILGNTKLSNKWWGINRK